MTQYTDYGTIPQAVRDLIANKCQLLDEYILMQTGQYTYTALIHDLITDEVEEITITRGSNYGDYSVSYTSGTWDYSVSNEYYVYSNVGYGAALDLPVMEGVIAHSSIILTCVLLLVIVFKSVLFPFSKKK